MTAFSARGRYGGKLLEVRAAYADGSKSVLPADLYLREQIENDVPERVCLCGSTRFMDTFAAAGWQLAMLGKLVLSVSVFHHNKEYNKEGIDKDVEDKLDELHLHKIDLAHWILVINVEDYTGESTMREIEHAKSLGKPVVFLFPHDDVKLRPGPPPSGREPTREFTMEVTRFVAKTAEAICTRLKNAR